MKRKTDQELAQLAREELAMREADRRERTPKIDAMKKRLAKKKHRHTKPNQP